MSRDDLKNLRRDLGMTQTEFGEWMAREINVSQDDNQKPVSAYTRQRIHAWENGDIALPAKVELVLLRRQLADKDKQIEDLKAKQRQRNKQT